MLKFVLLGIVLTVANGQDYHWFYSDRIKHYRRGLPEGLPVTFTLVARWSLAAMNQKLIQSGSEGFHAQVVGIKDFLSQVVAGTNYRFSMDTIYSQSNKYTVRFLSKKVNDLLCLFLF
jgi:hypothetical protein